MSTTPTSPALGPVLVTGGGGFIGGEVLRRLVAQGRPVRALARTDASAAELETQGARAVVGDLLDRASLDTALAGIEVVYHVAGVNEMCARDPSRMMRVNVEGTSHVLRAAAAAGVRRVVYTSSAATMGEEHGVVATEQTVHRGRYLSNYERSKHLAEIAAFQIAADTGLDVVHVNPSSVQGPGRTRGTAKILLDYLNGKLKVMVDSTLSVVDIADCTEGHILAEARGRSGERYLLSGATLTTREALAVLATVTGVERSTRALPRPAALAAGIAAGAIARLRGRRASLCHEMVRTILHGHAYDGSKATRELGLVYTPFEEQVRRTVAWYAEQGLVDRSLAPEGG